MFPVRDMAGGNMTQPPEWGQPTPPAEPPLLPPPPPPPGAVPPPGVVPPPPGAYVNTYAPQPGVAPKTDGFAIASLCCSFGILVISCFGIVTSILAIIFAKKAERNIAASGGMVGGAGLAKAGKIIGWCGIGLWIALVIFYIVFVAVSISNGSSN